jgi:hypothetical protein
MNSFYSFPVFIAPLDVRLSYEHRKDDGDDRISVGIFLELTIDLKEVFAALL